MTGQIKTNKEVSAQVSDTKNRGKWRIKMAVIDVMPESKSTELCCRQTK